MTTPLNAPDCWPHNDFSSSGGLDEPLIQQSPTTKTVITIRLDSPVVSWNMYYSTWWDHVCLLLVLPLLLCLQFAMALRYSTASTEFTPSMRDVGTVVGLFVMIAYVYKQCLFVFATTRRAAAAAAAKTTFSPAIYLLPEIMVDFVLGTVLLGSVELGWMVLVSCTLGLCVTVVTVGTLKVYSSYCLWTEEDNGLEEDCSNDEDCKIVTMFRWCRLNLQSSRRSSEVRQESLP